VTPAPRHRTTSLAVRLLTLTAIPVVALTVLGFQRIDAEQTAADQADAVVEAVELHHAVASVYRPAQLERIALEGLARLDELGAPRTVVVDVIGIDLEATFAANSVELDDALDDLRDRHRTIRLDDGELLGDRLGRIRGTLQAQRDLSGQRRADSDDVSAVFDDLFEVLAETIEDADPIVGGSAANARSQAQLDALAAVLVSAGDVGQVVLEGIVDRSEEMATRTLRTLATHATHIDRFEGTLDDDDLEEFTAVTSLHTGDSVPTTELSDDDAAVDPDFVQASAAAALAHLDYVDALAAFSDEFHLRIAESIAADAERAQQRSDRTALLIWSIAAITILLAVLVLVSILEPIRRLRRRAEAISNGDLDHEALPLRGPSDVRALTSTTNDMLATLHRVNDEINRFAAGDLAVAEAPDLPGAIGVSLRESVAHLATVTSELTRSQRLSSAIVTQAADAIWTVDETGLIRTANEAADELTGVGVAEQLGRPITEFLSQTSGEATVLVPSDPQPTVLVAHSDVDVDGERITAVIAHDISERSRFEERLTYQAHHDALTGLPNRFAVLEHLEHLVASDDTDVAVLFVDLDSFKSVNDTQGHAVGDRVLADIASTIADTVRDGEFVGRLGGDEFVVISRDFAQPADVMALGHRIIREVEQPHEHCGQVFVLSASVGVTIPPPGTSALDTIRQADNAVYQAKRRGRGRVELFDASMQERIEREAELELALRHAVRNDELIVHLQPVVDLRTGAIGGAEALVRWERPGHGMVPPNDFIPVAERSSLIFEVERWVLTEVCELLADWRDHDPDVDLRIAVNISGRHLIEGDLVADIDAALSLTGADSRMLELELTETQLLEDLERATGVLESLRSRGITIAVDDFGTGYSSMAYLRHLPIDSVKIDRTFVARATEHGYDSTVIEALLTIGRTLDLSIVAEGVETDDQLEFVRARGCDRAQGFLLARPMPVDEAEAIIFGAADHADELDPASA
jgi:diguanylate cyclase (GGDEF)-like protein